MSERRYIDVFVDGLIGYFDHLNESLGSSRSVTKNSELGQRSTENVGLELGTPYLLKNEATIGMDFTGMINVSGSSVGTIFVSAPRALLKRILLSYGEAELRDELLRDLVGEIANTLAGNARRELGADFHISIPRVIQAPLNTKDYSLDAHCYLLPFRWRSSKAELIISVKDS